MGSESGLACASPSDLPRAAQFGSKIAGCCPRYRKEETACVRKCAQSPSKCFQQCFLSHGFHIKLSSHDPVFYISVPFFPHISGLYFPLANRQAPGCAAHDATMKVAQEILPKPQQSNYQPLLGTYSLLCWLGLLFEGFFYTGKMTREERRSGEGGLRNP